MGKQTRETLFSPAEKTGLAVLALAPAVFFVHPALALLPLVVFLLLCLAAPFFPTSRFFLPVISRAGIKTDGIALTFDDGPSLESTPILLDLLARYHLPATFFVVGEKAAQYPELIAAILADGHTIGNHSLNHDYFLMLRSWQAIQKDIRTTQEILRKSGVLPLVFRPPSGITSPPLKKALAGENLNVVTFSCRAYDRGNRNVRNLAGKILRRLRPGNIIMLHDLPPWQQSMAGSWQEELVRLFAALQEDYRVVPLEEIIGMPVMESIEEGSEVSLP